MEMYSEEMMTEAPKVWLIRAQYGSWTEAFVNNGYIGIHYNLDPVDMSEVKSVDEIRRIYARENPDVTSPQRIGNRAGQIGRFHLETKSRDFVLTPGADHDEIYFGRFSSDSTYYTDGSDGLPCRNRKSVDWSPRKLSRGQLPSNMTNARRTVTEIRDEVSKTTFFELIGEHAINPVPSLKMPEDSWVPFHLEVGKRLIEEEMWKPELRQVFGNLVTQVMGSAGVFDTNDVGPWTPDPYSFYLAFNTATEDRNRDSGYARVQELLQMRASAPERGHYARNYGVHYWGEMRPQEAGIEILWEFFRFVFSADPLNDEDDASEFVDRFDKVDSSLVPGIASATISHWLYWIDPTKYVMPRRLHWRELGLAGHLGLAESIEGGARYLAALKAVDEFAKTRGMTVLDINRGSTTREMLGLDTIANDGTDEPYGIDEMLDDGLFFERSELERILERFKDKKNLILQGPPGVGKTFVSRRLAYALIGERADDRIVNVQFHQSYSYEDFVVGYRPNVNDQQQLIFLPQLGSFLELCEKARRDKGQQYVMIIDEVNRANMSRVFGELLSMIEVDKRGTRDGVRLPIEVPELGDRCRNFSVPENVYILGTMNLADRSLAGMDYAMRRRFAFVTLEPQFGKSVFEDWLRGRDVPNGMIERINSQMSALNEVIASDSSLGRNFDVGHSYFCDVDSRLRGNDGKSWDAWYRNIVETEIQPLLEEYWFDDLKKADDAVRELLDGVPERRDGENQRDDSIDERVCTRCGVSKPLTEEHWNRNVLARGSGYCKPCDSERVSEWRRSRANGDDVGE